MLCYVIIDLQYLILVSVVFDVHEVVIQNRNCGVQGGQILRNAISLSCIL